MVLASLGLLAFAAFLLPVAIGMLHPIVEKPDASVGRVLMALLFGAVVGGLGAYCLAGAVIGLFGRTWEVFENDRAISGIFQTTFGFVTSGGVYHLLPVAKPGAPDVNTDHLRGSGKKIIARSDGRFPHEGACVLFFALAGLASSGAAEVALAELRSWGKPTLLRRLQRSPAILTLVLRRRDGVQQSAALEIAFAGALAALEADFPPKRWFELSDLMPAVRKEFDAAVESSSSPSGSLDAAAVESIAREVVDYADVLRAKELRFSSMGSREAHLLGLIELARRLG